MLATQPLRVAKTSAHKTRLASCKTLALIISHKAVTTLEDAAPNARRVLGAAHPLTAGIEKTLRLARAALRAREAPPRSTQ